MAKAAKKDTEQKKVETPEPTGPAQIPYAGKVLDRQQDGTYARNVKAVKAEEVSAEDTGQIDLHLQAPDELEKTINREVSKLNEGFSVAVLDPEKNKLGPVEKIEVLKEMYLGTLIDPKKPEKGYKGGLVIRGIKDKEGYKKADEVRKMLVKLRTSTVKRHGGLKENYIKIGKGLDKAKNTIVSGVEEIEQELERRLKVVDDLQQQEDDRIEREKKEKTDCRVAELKENGLRFDGSFYAIGDQISVDVVTIGALNDEEYLKFLSRVKNENERLTFLEYKNEQRERVEKYLFFRKQRKHNEDQKKLEDDRKKQKESRAKMRLTLLKMLGFVANANETIYQIKKDAGVVSVTTSDITENEAEEWDKRFADLTKEIEDLNTTQTEWENKEVERKRDLERYNKMLGIGYVYEPQRSSFLIRTQELGDTCLFSAQRVYGNLQDFDQWFELVAKFEAEKTRKAVEKLREDAKELQERTNNRIAELVNGFGLINSGVGYYKPSNYWHEPELLALKNAFLIDSETIKTLGEGEWTEKIDALTVNLSMFQQAELEIKTRKEKETEDARISMLSQAERVNIYLDKIGLLEVPEGLTDERLQTIVLDVLGAIKTARNGCKLIQQEK